MRDQSVIDQRLVAASPGVLDNRSEVRQHPIVEADRDLGLSGFLGNDRPAPEPREVDIPVGLTRNPLLGSSLAGWLSTVSVDGLLLRRFGFAR